jgi:lycopene cyclase CruP
VPSLQERLQRVPGNPWQQLQRADRAWAALKQSQAMPVTAVGGAGQGTWTETQAAISVQETSEVLGAADWDVVIAGGTLGMLVAWGLRRRGYRVAVLDRGALQGRRQEWNISRAELHTLIDLELLTPAELATAIVTEYNPGRIQFVNSPVWWVKDVLNVGVRPDILLDLVKNKLVQQGGYIGAFQPVDSPQNWFRCDCNLHQPERTAKGVSQPSFVGYDGAFFPTNAISTSGARA